MYLSAVSLPGSKMLALRDGAGPGTRADGGPDRCPLLLDDRCLLYDARPVICRTHGYPLLVEGRVDHCPKNFTSLRTIESNLILDLDAINTILAGVNIAFMKENGDRRFSRVRIGVPDLLNMLGP
jgi:Fe-S-cluster containining protein